MHNFDDVSLVLKNTGINVWVLFICECRCLQSVLRIRDILVRIRDPGHGLMDSDPDPAIFAIDLQDATKN